MLISHANIRHDVLYTELANAKLDPDGQVFPWRDMYPLVGQTVYADGQFWTVAHKELEMPSAGPLNDWEEVVQLHRVGPCSGPDARLTFAARRSECRPVTWTQDDEAVFG